MTADQLRFDAKLKEAKDKARQPCHGHCLDVFFCVGCHWWLSFSTLVTPMGQMYLWLRRCVQLLAKEHLYKLLCGASGEPGKRKPEKPAEEPAPADDAPDPKAKSKAKAKSKTKKAKGGE